MKVFFAGLMLLFAGAANAQTAADYVQECSDQQACSADLKEFTRWFPKAMRGDYQAQRNVSFCLSDGCNGAVRKLPITACAWRLVIIASGNKDVDQTDTMNAKFRCGGLDDLEKQAAVAQAETLMKKIKR